MENQNADETRITQVKIRFADKTKKGLVGWASCILDNAIFLNNVMILRDESGRYSLRFPIKKSKRNKIYSYFEPVSDESMQMFTKAIYDKLKETDADEYR